MDEKVSFKFITVSAFNFFVGYLIFSFTWLTFKDHLRYLPIAAISTTFSAIWSFQTHNRITLNRRRLRSFISPQYLSLQLIALLLSSLVVPFFASYLGINLLIIQFFWAVILSLIGLVVLVKYSN
jgi:putative flippase GtrA